VGNAALATVLSFEVGASSCTASLSSIVFQGWPSSLALPRTWPVRRGRECLAGLLRAGLLRSGTNTKARDRLAPRLCSANASQAGPGHRNAAAEPCCP
jgi:hypothetical protein